MIEEPHSQNKNTIFWVALLMFVLLLIGYIILQYNNAKESVVTTQEDLIASLTNSASGFTADSQSGGFEQSDAVIETDDDPYFGSKDARVRIVEFGDFECPFCGQMFDTVRQLETQFGSEIFFQYRDFPVVLSHPNALDAARASECAHEQGLAYYWAYHDRLFQFQKELSPELYTPLAERVGLDVTAFTQCFTSNATQTEVEEDYYDGLAAGVPGTPTFFINGKRVPGVIPQETLYSVINQLLSQSQ